MRRKCTVRADWEIDLNTQRQNHKAQARQEVGGQEQFNVQHYDKMIKTCCITPTPILPFSDEFCQLLRRNLAMLHVVVEHVEAIVFFTLGVRDRHVSHSGNNLSPVARTLPSQCSLKSSTVSVSGAHAPGVFTAGSAHSYSSLPFWRAMKHR